MSQERVILVGVETEKNYLHFDSSMKELKSLTKTANGEVVFSLVQKRQQSARGKLRNCSSWQKHMKQI